jgi:catechol 2,3-dioxygenase-like lactoylglutathione lyase family enzyme
MKARAYSHTGITVSDFDRFVQFYANNFGCRLIGVGDSDPARVRAFFSVDAEAPTCRIGWLRTPGGGMLEIFHFTPSRPAQEVVWSRVGLTHISFDVKDCYKWRDTLAQNGVEIVAEVEESQHGHSFFFVKDCDGNLIELIDLRIRYPFLKWLGALGGWLFRRGRYQKHYGLEEGPGA